MRRWIFGLSAVVATTALVLACSVGTDCDFGLCAGPPVGRGEGGADATDGAPLDPCLDTPTDPKCLDETKALFVSGKANPTGADGSRAHPFTTITAALAVVSATRKRLYVCEGTYAENVTVQASISLLGGLTCDWTAKGANPAIAPSKGVALSILKSDAVTVADVDVEGSADSQLDGDSAIGVFVSESKAVLLRRVNVKSGAGRKGTTGADGSASPNYASAIASTGLGTATNAAAEAPACGTCTDGSLSTGGKGAASGGVPLTGGATPAVGSDNSGASGGSCVDGKPGAPGLAGGAAAAAQAAGTLKAMGWDSALASKKGSNGNPGQGGGGGGSTSAPALGGGSGGCGGCGGTGGGPGRNGGSSFALLSFDSELSIEDSTLTTAAGGVGGPGGKGQDGQFRGPAGGGACAGGVGGHGAGGGGGGGGAGGHSAAVAHSGKAPVVTRSTLKPGLAGDLGAGGAGGASTGNAGAPGNPGPKGSSAEVLPL